MSLASGESHSTDALRRDQQCAPDQNLKTMTGGSIQDQEQDQNSRARSIPTIPFQPLIAKVRPSDTIRIINNAFHFSVC